MKRGGEFTSSKRTATWSGEKGGGKSQKGRDTEKKEKREDSKKGQENQGLYPSQPQKGT